jgi:hypothetical protein
MSYSLGTRRMFYHTTSVIPKASHSLGMVFSLDSLSRVVKPSQTSLCYSQPNTVDYDPHLPINRANPCPEVTDQFCRLPLPTLFYEPEAVNLGDLLRIWVRLGARGISA